MSGGVLGFSVFYPGIKKNITKGPLNSFITTKYMPRLNLKSKKYPIIHQSVRISIHLQIILILLALNNNPYNHSV